MEKNNVFTSEAVHKALRITAVTLLGIVDPEESLKETDELPEDLANAVKANMFAAIQTKLLTTAIGHASKETKK